jgi:hypothetical protein
LARTHPALPAPTMIKSNSRITHSPIHHWTAKFMPVHLMPVHQCRWLGRFPSESTLARSVPVRGPAQTGSETAMIAVSRAMAANFDRHCASCLSFTGPKPAVRQRRLATRPNIGLYRKLTFGEPVRNGCNRSNCRRSPPRLRTTASENSGHSNQAAQFEFRS